MKVNNIWKGLVKAIRCYCHEGTGAKALVKKNAEYIHRYASRIIFAVAILVSCVGKDCL